MAKLFKSSYRSIKPLLQLQIALEINVFKMLIVSQAHKISCIIKKCQKTSKRNETKSKNLKSHIFSFLLLLLFMNNTISAASSPCFTTGGFPYKSMPLTTPITEQVECPGSHNAFRFVINFKLSKLPSPSKKQMIATLMYPDVQLYSILDGTGTKAILILKLPLGQTKNIVEIINIENGGTGGSTGNWYTISIEIINSNLTIIIREWPGPLQVISEDINYLTSPFSFPTSSEPITFAKAVASDQEPATGVLASWVFSCEPLRAPQSKSILSLVSYMELPSLRGFYVLDGPNQSAFYNEANDISYNPVLMRGALLTNESIEDPQYISADGTYRIFNGSFITLNFENFMDYQNQITKGYSIVFKLKMVALPTAGTESKLMISWSRHVIEVRITNNGKIKFTTNNNTLFLYQTTFTLATSNDYKVLKISMVRIVGLNILVVTIDHEDNTGLEETFAVDVNLVNQNLSGVLNEYRFISGSENLADMTIHQFSVFRGVVKIRKASHPTGCYSTPLTPTNLNPCLTETLFTTEQFCFDCTAYWKMYRTQKTLYCGTIDLSILPDIIRQVQLPTANKFYPLLNQKKVADLGKYFIGSILTTCYGPDNCASCSSSSPGSCTSCISEQNRFLQGGVCQLCTVSTSQWFSPVNQGSCNSCPTIGCSLCGRSGDCYACSDPNDVLFYELQICCNVNNGKFVNTYKGPYSCDNCYSSCKTCTGAAQTQCSSCQTNYVLDNVTKSCNPCPTGTWFNSGTCSLCSAANCSTCPLGVCTSCQPFYVVSGGTCQACGPGNSQFKDPSGFCKLCAPGCLNCTSATSCQICKTDFPYILYNQVCYQCNSSQYLDLALLTCGICNGTCSTCSLRADNCTSCFSGFDLILKPNGDKECIKKKQTVVEVTNKCSTDCELCDRDYTQFCTRCREGYCTLNTGVCALCPAENQNSPTKIYFNLKKNQNNEENFSIIFSEQLWFARPSFDSISNQFQTVLVGYIEGKDYTLLSTYKKEKQTLELTFKFFKSIE